MSGKENLEKDYPILKELSISTPPQQWQNQILRCHEFLCRENKKVNLTRITSFNDYLVKHIIDSLLLAAYMPEITSKKLNIADVGCGAGFPGVPMAVSYPNLTLTEIDSVNKKYLFVEQLIRELKLKNCISTRGRAGELALKTAFKYQFDIVIARAVTDAATMMIDCNFFLRRPDGVLIFYKTPKKIKEEISDVNKQAEMLKMTATLSPEFNLPHDMGKRQFLVISLNR